MDRCSCDFDIKIGSKEEAAWNEVYVNSEKALSDAKRAAEINQVISDYSKKRLEEEKAKFK